MFGLAERRAERAEERRHRQVLRSAGKANAIQVVIACATLASVAIGAVVLIRDISNKNDRIDDLESGRGPITRSVGGSEREFDVEEMLIDEDDQPSLSDLLVYEKDDRIYWPQDDEGVWSHEVMSELDFIASTLGLTVEELEAEGLPPEIAELADLPLHSWRRPESHEITTSYGEPIGDEFTFVTVERIADDELVDAFARSAAADDTGSTSYEPLERLLDEGRTGAMLQVQLTNLFLLGTTVETTPVLQTVDMREEAAYLKVIRLYRDVVVDGEPVDQYFATTEVIVLDLPPDLVLIATNVPSGPDRRGPDFEHVNALLDGLLVVE